ncbi:hypothetical protein BABINDRAFT_159195 [Babjeviella inositovora NRRL Y-12698]|uniref:Uncharacterized protein n=1 Tax=Babjeviella inositovora NRRL Y-12698 TaxID=984486 RepID=A0A1E3QYG9_9ASCO|nr:uncharacterized protein BABINDRAFT_159195 [Babjeviella inositovora NRRL Y-12698]ODQ82661.1 hypothetical protein BABINDRAFT_159195 [Babjeviella inositovora NRRL Y-12698]
MERTMIYTVSKTDGNLKVSESGLRQRTLRTLRIRVEYTSEIPGHGDIPSRSWEATNRYPFTGTITYMCFWGKALEPYRYMYQKLIN